MVSSLYASWTLMTAYCILKGSLVQNKRPVGCWWLLTVY